MKILTVSPLICWLLTISPIASLHETEMEVEAISQYWSYFGIPQRLSSILLLHQSTTTKTDLVSWIVFYHNKLAFNVTERTSNTDLKDWISWNTYRISVLASLEYIQELYGSWSNAIVMEKTTFYESILTISRTGLVPTCINSATGTLGYYWIAQGGTEM